MTKKANYWLVDPAKTKFPAIFRAHRNSESCVTILVASLQFNKRFLVTRLSLLVLVIPIPSGVGLILDVVNTLSLVHGVLNAQAREHSVVGWAEDDAGRQHVFSDELRQFLGITDDSFNCLSPRIKRYFMKQGSNVRVCTRSPEVWPFK